MKISVSYEDNLYPLDISDDSEVEILKTLLEFESGVPVSEFAIYYNGVQMREIKKTLKYYGVKNGEILVMIRRIPRPPTSSGTSSVTGLIDWKNITVPGSSSGLPSATNPTPRQGPFGSIDPLVFREMLLVDTHQRSLLKERNPPLSQALESGDPQQFAAVFNQQKKVREEQEALRRRMVQANPFDIVAQQKIEEEIQQANINSNMEAAMEFSPESFGQVTMLYINCLVNGHPVKAFVDSGAQMTIMSVACAERCNIMRLVDRRWAGLAKGVGTQKIIGRVHMAQIQIEQVYLPSSFAVLESQPMDMLLGLDMLKRHQCLIDLEKNILKIGTTGTITKFLPESELPGCARLSGNASREMEDKDLAEALNRSAQEAASNSSVASSGSAGQSTSGLQSSFAPLPSNVSEADVVGLINMGFNREDILRELEKNGGDVNKTAAVLLTRNLRLPPN